MAAQGWGKEKVPAEPFSRWLNERYEFHFARLDGNANPNAGILTAVLDEIGWDGDAGQRRLWRYRRQLSESQKGRKAKTGERGTKVVRTAQAWPRHIVEDALHHAGVRFEELYPEIAAAEDRPLEPDQWCLKCQENVTPIDDQCPWNEKHRLVPWAGNMSEAA